MHAQSSSHGISAANINVVQNDISNNTSSVTVTTTLSINGFAIRPGSNRGDYNVQVGAGFSDDVDTGVMMVSVAQNGRDNGEAAYPGLNYCTPAFDYSRSGGSAGAYWLATFNAPAGAEYNVNVSAASFPYDKWLGGYARNSANTNGGPNDLFTGSPGLVLGSHFIDNGGGVSTVDLTSLGVDSRTSGVLLVCHGGNEDNYATSQVNSNNGTWTIYLKDSGANQAANEQDPVAFVFIPKTNTTVVSGRFRGDGARLMFSGATPQFNVTNISTGTWRLTIDGQNPNSGVLIISPEGGFSVNQDDMVTYQADDDGWLIQSRDLPNDPPGLQTPSGEPVCSFVFIPAATTVSVLAPPDGAQGMPNSPELKVAVSNAAPGSVKVQFFGRVANVNGAGDFCIVALPDTQYYTAERYGGTKEMFIAQTEWIINNRVSRNIAYVAHLGDISDSGDIKSGVANTTEWRNATNAMYRVENPTRTQLPYGIPYGMAVGNHDEEPIGDVTGTTTHFNRYFGVDRFTGRSYYAGHYGTNNNNHFDFFSAGGMDFIVMYFEFDANANPTVLAWANAVLQTNANRRAIIVTHNFGNTSTPVSFSPQGSAIYNALKGNQNLFLMLAGHVTGQGSRVDTFNGNTVRTFVSDYQGWENGGNGYLRVIDFSPVNNQVVLSTYSPYLGKYTNSPTSDIFFNYNMLQPTGAVNAPYDLLGTFTNVPPGGVASLIWTGRTSNTKYEWYATVTDASSNIITGPTWQFTTAPNSPPVASNRLVTVFGDAPTNLTLTAFDANGDHLTFSATSPSHGVNLDFDPDTGTLTYVPARGFRGFDRFTYHANDGTADTTVATMNINVLAPPDSNGNGLPDAWEAAYGVSSPYADNDGDGRNNLEEYMANTNPTNAASVFQLSIVGYSPTASTNGGTVITWPSVGGTRYRVQFSDNGVNFTDVMQAVTEEMDSTLPGTPGTQVFVDDYSLTGSAPTNGTRYYRVKLVQ